MEENNVISLTDEEGTEFNFEVLDLIEYHGEEYVVLYPEDDGGEPQEAVILLCKDDDETGEDSFEAIEDDYLLEKIFNIFKERAKDRFNFVD